ncbi:MAG: hypothetical protein F6J90_05545 [Moorea sp. SIOASIH]|uniref:hypothetical protein n=1 Tax=Moorena sp. SIOASIH TaxID=2607817 RepID=UPI0013BA2FDD|nr:hypothetical protein [Moorena sp. SIOASIH]NEO35816.1 hypothetical protein [Moorena sp. SIOASIH]
MGRGGSVGRGGRQEECGEREEVVDENLVSLNRLYLCSRSWWKPHHLLPTLPTPPTLPSLSLLPTPKTQDESISSNRELH